MCLRVPGKERMNLQAVVTCRLSVFVAFFQPHKEQIAAAAATTTATATGMMDRANFQT